MNLGQHRTQQSARVDPTTAFFHRLCLLGPRARGERPRGPEAGAQAASSRGGGGGPGAARHVSACHVGARALLIGCPGGAARPLPPRGKMAAPASSR